MSPVNERTRTARRALSDRAPEKRPNSATGKKIVRPFLKVEEVSRRETSADGGTRRVSGQNNSGTETKTRVYRLFLGKIPWTRDWKAGSREVLFD